MKILLLLFLPILTQGQIIYKGSIINKSTKEKVPYSSVGLIKENTGINANEEGYFILPSKNYINDTLIISSVGYETFKICVNNLPENLQYEISENPIPLKTVIINSNYNESTTLNDFSNCGLNSYTSNGSVTQIAQHFRSPIANSLLSKLEICKVGDNSLFRIRIYDMDSLSGKPSTDLADTIIEVKSGKRHVNIDLEPYKIIIPGKDFFIAIEWLYIAYNQYSVKDKRFGKKQTYFHYNPDIFFKERNSNSTDIKNNLEVWYLDYRKKWFRLNPNWGFLISAKVKYQSK